MNSRDNKTEHELSFNGRIFGYIRTPRFMEDTKIGDLITIYTEDDGPWHYSQSFDEYWLTDFVKVLKECQGPRKITDEEIIAWATEAGITAVPTPPNINALGKEIPIAMLRKFAEAILK